MDTSNFPQPLPVDNSIIQMSARKAFEIWLAYDINDPSSFNTKMAKVATHFHSTTKKIDRKLTDHIGKLKSFRHLETIVATAAFSLIPGKARSAYALIETVIKNGAWLNNVRVIDVTTWSEDPEALVHEVSFGIAGFPLCGEVELDHYWVALHDHAFVINQSGFLDQLKSLAEEANS